MNMIFYAANGHGYCAYSFDNFIDTDKNLLQILVRIRTLARDT